MLSAQSVGLLREGLKEELQHVLTEIEFWKGEKIGASKLGKIKPRERTDYLLAEHMINRAKKRRRKIEQAIKEVKANLWNGSVKSFPVSSFVLSPPPQHMRV